MRVHALDGTYELFRHFYALPSRLDPAGREVGAVLGVLESVISLLRYDATHLGVATDHTVESFRNDLWSGYKTGEGIDPSLFAQFHPLEEALEDLGVTVWPMIEQEADDGLAAAAARAAEDPRVRQVVICSPDKDLAQCVRGQHVVQLDRRKRETRDADGVRAKFGVSPESIPDWLALVGDAADGFPGVPRWGAKSAAAVLARHEHLERIPEDPAAWENAPRGAKRLAEELASHRDDAFLFRRLATLRTDAPVFTSVDELEWKGPTARFPDRCAALGAPALAKRAARLRESSVP